MPQPGSATAATPNASPRIWLVVGHKPGDNAQLQIVADALGWPYEIRQLTFLPQYVRGKPPFKVTLDHVDWTQSEPLEPPWPDLVMTVGRRPTMAALWIREQARGRTRTVVVGRPKRWLERFDLVIAPPQFRLPQRANVEALDLPLMRIDRDAIAAAADDWRPRLAHLPRPLTAVLIGGPTKPWRFDVEVARDLLQRAVALADGGTLYLSTSHRTREPVVEFLQNALPDNARLYRWGEPDNPYRALLGLADRFVVTGDSISMMVEVARLGKPLAIAALPRESGAALRVRDLLGRQLAAVDAGALEPLVDFLFATRIVKFSRDLTEVHRMLFNRNLAVPFGQPFQKPAGTVPDELGRAAARVRALMAAPAA